VRFRRKRLTGDDPGLVWPSWSVDLPGLSEANAERVISWANRENVSLGGSAVDPAVWYSVNFDSETVQPVLDGLRIALDSKALNEEQRRVITLVAEDMGEWLTTASE
jgi:hypothetical protein